jgi:hypothetical protein
VVGARLGRGRKNTLADDGLSTLIAVFEDCGANPFSAINPRAICIQPQTISCLMKSASRFRSDESDEVLRVGDRGPGHGLLNVNKRQIEETRHSQDSIANSTGLVLDDRSDCAGGGCHFYWAKISAEFHSMPIIVHV